MDPDDTRTSKTGTYSGRYLNNIRYGDTSGALLGHIDITSTIRFSSGCCHRRIHEVSRKTARRRLEDFKTSFNFLALKQ